MMTDLELLTALVERIEASGQEHRLCVFSPRYNSADTDKFYNAALQKGLGANTLGTVWYYAELAGVDLKGLARPDRYGSCGGMIGGSGETPKSQQSQQIPPGSSACASAHVFKKKF